ncbi:MAG: decaprenyl-phosphate phosphoribosyltransferase [bacterium]|nr:decaprenyl-phosphate phosphoribosyltransferase [bacterium]
MVARILGIGRSLRPRQWLKNAAVFAGIVLTGRLTEPAAIISVIQAFLLFNAVSSAMYLVNDVLDRERDLQHPFKRYRPIARGLVPVRLALTLAFALIMVSLPLAYALNINFFVAVVLYLLLQVAYSSFLKHIILVDVMAIAVGFILRVYAGVWVIDAHLSVWFFLCVLSGALFLAIAKRRSELTLLGAQAESHRKILSHYPAALLDILTTMFATAAWLSYAMFVFLFEGYEPRRRFAEFLTDFFSQSAENTKWLMLTVPIVTYGVMRYLYIVYEKKQGESPERVLLSDKPMLATAVLWVGSVIGILYVLGK